MNQLSAQVVVSAVVVYLLQLAKKSKLVPWITNETATLNRWVAVGSSLFASIGIHFTFSATAGVLTITGLTLAGIGHFVTRWLTSFVSQQLIFQTAVNKSPIPPELMAMIGEWAKAQQGLPSAKDLDIVAGEKSLQAAAGGKS